MLAGVPTPYKALYAASKTYIRNISIALSYELEASGVGVSVLITGASPTNEIVKDQIENGALAARITAMAPADIAKISIDKALSGKRIITTSFKNKLIMNFIASLPYSVLSKVSINQYLKLNK
jgi:short-subunit dehydrogenase